MEKRDLSEEIMSLESSGDKFTGIETFRLETEKKTTRHIYRQNRFPKNTIKLKTNFWRAFHLNNKLFRRQFFMPASS